METFHFFNDLPDDVQRLIFEHAFEGNPTAVGLALVSRKVNGWVDPLIYRNIITSRISGNPLRETTRKPRDFYRSHVKSLLVDDISAIAFIEDILSECHVNLVGLAWWPVTHDRTKWASYLLTQPFPSMRKLSVFYGIFPSELGPPLHAPIFQNLTHLDIGLLPSNFPATGSDLSDAGPRRPAQWEGLQHLESLLHLHLDMVMALSFREPDAAKVFQAIILDLVSHIPGNTQYICLYLPYRFLVRAADLPNHSHRIYVDLIWGRLDPRIVVSYPTRYYMGARSGKTTHAHISVEGFSNYLLSRTRNDRIYRVALSEVGEDFWTEAEAAVCRRNKELYKVNNGIASSSQGR